MAAFPRIIHQIWLQGSDLIPEEYKPFVQRNKDMNPKFTHILWDDKSIQDQMARHPDQTYFETYISLPHLHAKVDFGRYFLLFKYGGISIDMDAYCNRNLEDLDGYIDPDKEMVLGELRVDWVGRLVATASLKNLVNNATIIVKGSFSPVMKSFLDFCTQKCRQRQWSTRNKNQATIDITNTTGPKALREWLDTGIHQNLIQIVPPEVFEPCLSETDSKCLIRPSTFIVHRYSNSWLSPTAKKGLIVYQNHSFLIWCVLLLIVSLSLLSCKFS